MAGPGYAGCGPREANGGCAGGCAGPVATGGAGACNNAREPANYVMIFQVMGGGRITGKIFIKNAVQPSADVPVL